VFGVRVWGVTTLNVGYTCMGRILSPNSQVNTISWLLARTRQACHNSQANAMRHPLRICVQAVPCRLELSSVHGTDGNRRIETAIAGFGRQSYILLAGSCQG
jgi:hypothetical protein